MRWIQVPDREHILWEGQSSSPLRVQINEASTVGHENIQMSQLSPDMDNKCFKTFEDVKKKL